LRTGYVSPGCVEAEPRTEGGRGAWAAAAATAEAGAVTLTGATYDIDGGQQLVEG